MYYNGVRTLTPLGSNRRGFNFGYFSGNVGPLLRGLFYCYKEDTMCGIVGYVGKSQDPRLGLEALKRLEYRGYDSAGMAVYNPATKSVYAVRAEGQIAEMEKKISTRPIVGTPFIFHTRWATHGAPSERNAHPHQDCTGSFWVVHNGIIENYRELKDRLIQQGHSFTSETDTEVIPHLIESHYRGDLLEAVRSTVQELEGTYGLVVLSSKEPDKLIAARLGSPLLVGMGDGEYIIASDASAIVARTKKVVYLEDGDLAVITPESFSLTTQGRVPRQADVHELEGEQEDVQKGGYAHFMQKEIHEQPDSLHNTLRGRIVADEGLVKLGGLDDFKEQLRGIEKIHIVACGSAYYAGLVGEYMLEEYAGIPTEVDVASEFRYRKPVVTEKMAVLLISQSGETADTIAVQKEMKQKGVPVFGIVNVVGSTIARDSDAGVYNHAGPEIGVATSKAFTSQLAVLAMLTVFLGRQRDMSYVFGHRIGSELTRIPDYISDIIKQESAIEKIAHIYHKEPNIFFIGRKYNYPIALEGALKLKEISYNHAEGLGAGELKHGHIALIEEGFPVVAIAPQDSVYPKMISNMEEVKARGGKIIAITTEGNTDIASLADHVIFIPRTLELLTPILSVVPLQLLAYHMAVANGRDPDKPRNLAKSVTVE